MSDMNSKISSSVVTKTFTSACLVFGLLVGLPLLALIFGDNFEWSMVLFPLAAVVAVFVISGPIWRAINKKGTTRKRAMIAGGLIGLFAHLMMWILVVLFGVLFGFDTIQDTFAEALSGILTSILFGSGFSLFYSGGSTIVVGLLLGRWMFDKYCANADAQISE